MRFLQSSRLLPLAVRIDSSLTQNMAQKSDTERRRISTMVASLHQYRIQIVVQDIDSPEDALACAKLEIDFAAGPLFGEPLALAAKPLLDTCLVTSSALSALNEPPAPLPDANLLPGEYLLPEEGTPFDAGTSLPDEMPGESNVSVLDDANDPADDFSSRLGSASFRLPPPTR
jgi:hypothetical protein